MCSLTAHEPSAVWRTARVSGGPRSRLPCTAALPLVAEFATVSRGVFIPIDAFISFSNRDNALMVAQPLFPILFVRPPRSLLVWQLRTPGQGDRMAANMRRLDEVSTNTLHQAFEQRGEVFTSPLIRKRNDLIRDKVPMLVLEMPKAVKAGVVCC